MQKKEISTRKVEIVRSSQRANPLLIAREYNGDC